MSQLALQLIQQEKELKTGYLDIGKCGLTPDNPQLQAVWDALSELTHLETLILSNRWYNWKKKGWMNSKNKSKKNLLDNIPTVITGLTHLKKIVIGGNSNEKWKISKLENLPQSITRLDIRNNQISKLENLPQSISQLEIRGNQISKLENLPQSISLLNIRLNQISKLENLPQSISQLDISANQISKLENLPQSISQLDISSNQISKLENLPQSISQLDISANQISKLENLPQSISQLYIRYNQISKLENLPQSISLLYISSNQIKDLSPMQVFLERKENPLSVFSMQFNIGKVGINVYKNPLENPPMEVVNEGNKAIIRYFEELEKSGEIQVKEAKLMLTGSGEVGKTSLSYRLIDRDKQLPQKEARTKQIDVDKYHFNTNSNENFTAHIWDFGGQQIIHHFHRFFMNDSSLYILLTETSRENDDFDYWLQTIQLYGKESPILFVQNKRNGMPRSLDISHYQNNFNIKDELYDVNLLDNDGLDDLEKAIQYHIQKLPHTQRTIPRSWLGIREALDKLKVESDGYITFEKFREVCREQDITERAKIEDVGQFLHRLGVVLWYKDNAVLRQKIILERHWATEGIFKLVFDEAIQKTGHFSFDQAQALWDTEDTYCYHTNDLIELMREFKICFPRKSQPDHYIIPALLTATAPQVEWIADNRMTVEYYYPTILPRGLINYLTAEMYSDIRDDAHAWSAGVWLHAGDTQAKIEENRFHRKIRITLSGAQHREMFGGIKKVIDNIHKDYPGMEPELRIPCICDTCLKLPQDEKKYYEYSDIVRRLERGKATAECNVSYDDVPVKDLLNHILRREDYDDSYKAPQTMKKVFFSYSKKDIELRDELDVFLEPLKDKMDTWHDREMLAGSKWEKEIKQKLHEANIFLCLLSSDFLATDYIMNEEVPVMLEKYEKGEAVIIPVVVRSCGWETSVFEPFQALPEKGQPVTEYKNRDAAWKVVFEGIKKRI